jgi:Fe-S oxidoreductase
VNIDTAEVSILEREVLATHHARPTAWPTRMVLGYLSSRSHLANKIVRRTMLQCGGLLQRSGARLIGGQSRRHKLLAPFYAPVPPIASRTLPALLPPHETNQAVFLTPQKGAADVTVFYFPGCGSERLHTDIALAALFLLLQAGVRVVLPPKYLCCGFAARANAKTDLNNRQELRNTIIFNQIRSMLGHLDFDSCVVSCGTCREAMVHTHADTIFDAPVQDVASFLLARGFSVTLTGPCLYHQPCHDSLDGSGQAFLEQMAPHGVKIVPDCCSESGTLALSRPDITAAMLERKRIDVTGHMAESLNAQLLTNCPACLNGLGRLQLIAPKHVLVALADACAPGIWRQTIIQQLAWAELIRY